MSRLIDVRDARPRGTAHWMRVGLAVLAAAAAGVALTWFMAVPSSRTATAQAPAFAPQPIAPAQQQVPAVVAAPTATQPAAPTVACAFQRIDIGFGGKPPLPSCVDATRVRQNGSVRSYVVEGGAEGWSLRIDTAGGVTVRTTLRARDGRRFRCEAAQCLGLVLGRHEARGTRSISLQEVRLSAVVEKVVGGQAAPSDVFVSARLSAPGDDQVPGLACTGASVAISAPDGAAHRFCGQGGAGFDIADDGTRTYRFQDFENQTLAIAVNAAQQVTRVEYGLYGCEGGACTGVSMSSVAPDNDAAERSFFFGRTPLFDGAAASAKSEVRPRLILNGSLVLPAQQ